MEIDDEPVPTAPIKNWQDEFLTFSEGPHLYFFKGEQVRKSATGVIKAYFSVFDGLGVVDKYYHSWKTNKNSKYSALVRYLTDVVGEDEAYAKNAILALWDHDKNVASSEGTAMHKQFEEIVLGRPVPNPMPECKQFRTWLDTFLEQGGWEIYAPEYMVVKLAENEARTPVWAGSIDLLLKHKKTPGVFACIDYKRTNPKDGYKIIGKETSSFSTGYGKGPFAEVPDTDTGKYSVQLNIYAHTLFHDYGIEARDNMYILQCHHTLERPNVYAVPRFDTAMELLTVVETADAIEEAKLYSCA